MQNDHNDTVVGIRQKGTQNWGYQDESGKLAFGPLSARTLFYDKGADPSSIMSKARQTLGSGDIEQIPVRRTLEVLEDATV